MIMPKKPWRTFGGDKLVHFVEDIDGEDASGCCKTLGELDRNSRYDLRISYNIRGAKPVIKRNLRYEGLRQAVARNLAIPYASLMNVFVAPRNGGNN
jgi:hypothetical protein